jgi:hypothetical protein
MKRVTSAILLTLFLYNIIGYYFSYSILHSENSAQMTIALQNSSSLEKLRIKKSELKTAIFSKDEKEISYNGETYDVKDISVEGDYLVLQCLHDKQEEVLITNLDKQTQNNLDTKSSPTNNGPEKSGQKNIVKDYFFTSKDVIFYNIAQDVIFKEPKDLISAFVVSLSVPPPQQV